MNNKPLGGRLYGSIGHISSSRLGTGDHFCNPGQEKIACEKVRDKYDRVIVTEKLDGSCCGVAKINNEIIALTRAGYIASSSPFKQHHLFNDWVWKNFKRFNSLLNNDEYVVGELLVQAHGTKYILTHEPFAIFDLFRKDRVIYEELIERISKFNFITPYKLNNDYEPMSVEDVSKLPSYHGADQPEGAVWKVERKDKVLFLLKYVRPEKTDGCYLNGLNAEIENPIWNQNIQKYL